MQLNLRKPSHNLITILHEPSEILAHNFQSFTACLTDQCSQITTEQPHKSFTGLLRITIEIQLFIQIQGASLAPVVGDSMAG